MTEKKQSSFEDIDRSAVLTVIGIIILFSFSIAVILIAPSLVDPTWTQPASEYQVQMYEISDPNFYIGSTTKGASQLQCVYHLKQDFSLLAFREDDVTRIIADESLLKYITKKDEEQLKLTSRLLLLRKPEEKGQGVESYNPYEQAQNLRTELQDQWKKEHPDWEEKHLSPPDYQIYQLYQPDKQEAFALAPSDSIIENWADQNFTILDPIKEAGYHEAAGVLYVNNPVEYLVVEEQIDEQVAYHYDPKGKPLKNLAELKEHPLHFLSRKELIQLGERLYAAEGCWYCHTDQTRTLIQDTILNGSAAYPAPPSSANEYVYQEITFPGTKRNGPDLSRVALKRPGRDWHRGHFWAPKTASKGSIMPAFRHFFDHDPRGTSLTGTGIPNYKFEAIYQYLMTKGSRITAPTQAWWLGKDPIDTKAIIEGKKKFHD